MLSKVPKCTVFLLLLVELVGWPAVFSQDGAVAEAHAGSEGTAATVTREGHDDHKVATTSGKVNEALSLRTVKTSHEKRTQRSAGDPDPVPGIYSSWTREVKKPVLTDPERIVRLEGKLAKLRDQRGYQRGDEDPETRITMNRLGTAYAAEGLFNKATALFDMALLVQQGAIGEKHESFIPVLNFLGALRERQRRFDEAEQLLGQSAELSRAILGDHHHGTLLARHYLGAFYFRQGQFNPKYLKKAGTQLIDLWEICSKNLGETHPITILQAKYLKFPTMHEDDRWKDFLIMSITPIEGKSPEEMRQISFGSRLHPLLIENHFYLQADNLVQLEVAYAGESAISTSQMFQNTLLSHNGRDSIISYCVQYPDPENVIALWRHMVLRKNEYFKYSTKVQNNISSNQVTNPVVGLHGDHKDELLKARRRLARHLYSPIEPEKDREWKRKVESFQGRVMVLEPAFRPMRPFATSEALMNVMKITMQTEQPQLFDYFQKISMDEDPTYNKFHKDQTWIDFSTYHYIAYPRRQPIQERILALIADPNSMTPMRLVDLGPLEDVETLLRVWYEQIKQLLPVEPIGEKLYQKLWSPLQIPEDKKTVFMSLDGLLHLLPFALLQDERGNYLTQQFNLVMATYPDHVLEIVPELSAGPPVLFYHPDYDGIIFEIGQDQPFMFTNLAGTLQEGKLITQKLQAKGFQPLIFEGVDASEKNLFGVTRPWLLHLATHAGYRPLVIPGDPGEVVYRTYRHRRSVTMSKVTDNRAIGNETKLRRGRGVSKLNSQGGKLYSNKTEIEFNLHQDTQKLYENGYPAEPFLESGLALTGSNRSSEDPEGFDGYFTALEVLSLDLRGTRLVTLSACETNLGDIGRGEGVYSLTRAFHIAGAQAVLATLWPVDDEATTAFMGAFYDQFLTSRDPYKALRNAQADMRESTKWRHPYYWAGFVVSGK